MGQIYNADNPPPPSTKVHQAWTEKTVPVTDGSERQMGKDSFLLLLMTQLQNQDPMNPVENTEMTAQLAQFSQLEQLTNMSKAINNMSGYIQAQNQFQTLSLIGKEVTAQNNGLSVTDGKLDVEGGIEVADHCKIKIYVLNAKGEQVRLLDWGATDPGSYDLAWDGKDNNNKAVADGYYYFQVQATGADGKALETGISPMVAGKISSVSFDDYGQPVIHMGHAQLGLTQVIEILDAGSIAAKKGEEEAEG